MSATGSLHHNSHLHQSRTHNSSSPPNLALNATPHSDQYGQSFQPCAATAAFFLYAQNNIILLLHHDTLAIERKIDLHEAPVSIIVADNLSERGAGRTIVSYDVSQNAYIWDVFTGQEIARFASYEQVLAAKFMRNGNIAFGNSQGNITLFEPSTQEHFNTRTIYDPVTALAPAADCRTFAIGYMNGSILVATLQPFTILSTLDTNRPPAPVVGLAWHGSSSKSSNDMLASQTSDGYVSVFSVAKSPSQEPARVIRALGGSHEAVVQGSWFAWSKNGRILQHVDGRTLAHDVRTKQVAYSTIPTVQDVVAITNYGPTATLFTVSRNHTIQQYDVNPSHPPSMVANVQHVPPNAPPTPPDSVGIVGITPPPPPPVPMTIPSHDSKTNGDYTSGDDGQLLSPIERMTHEMDQMEEERRDRVGPLSPVSSHASLSSVSSTGQERARKSKSRTRDRMHSSRQSEASEDTHFTDFSRSRHEPHYSMSSRSMSSAISTTTTSTRRRGSSRSRQQSTPIQQDGQNAQLMDLFPYTKARLSEVRFRPPQYPTNSAATPDILRKEMLSVVFGWEHDIESLIRDEQDRHLPGSASSVMLSRWLGDFDSTAEMRLMTSGTMNSSDWMLLALSNMPSHQAKQLSEKYVRNLFEKDDIHPAVGILLSAGEHNDAIEAYNTRGYHMEAVLLTCLVFPHDWQRQSHLVRKWGESAVTDGQAELAVRCFSCTSIESSEAWYSPRAQDAVFAAQQERFQSPLSPPPSATTSNRLKEKNASLRLITSFEDRQRSKAGLGVTPIADSALTPGGGNRWRSDSKGQREPITARTATPGAYKRTRLPSQVRSHKDSIDEEATPIINTARPSSRPAPRLRERDPDTAIDTSRRNFSDSLPSPAPGVFASTPQTSLRTREASRNRHNLHLNVGRPTEINEVQSPGPSTSDSAASSNPRHRRSGSSLSQETRPEDFSPLLTDGSMLSAKGRSIDRYIASLEEANANAQHAQHLRAESRSRLEQRHERSRSRARKNSESSYIKPPKLSPQSPVSLAEPVSRYSKQSGEESGSGENDARRTYASRSSASRVRGESRRRNDSPERTGHRSGSRTAARTTSRSRRASPEAMNSDRGRGHDRTVSGQRSPSSPSPARTEDRSQQYHRETRAKSIGARARERSSSRKPKEAGRRTISPERSIRARSSSRRPKFQDSDIKSATSERRFDDIAEEALGESGDKVRPLTRKEIAAKELEDRRMSLARRPSAPTIVSPDTLQLGNSTRPSLGERSVTADTADLPLLPSTSYNASAVRSKTVEPELMNRAFDSTTGVSTSSAPIGLPATPRAMRLPKYMRQNSKGDDIPAVPALPADATLAMPPPPPLEAEDTLAPLLPSTRYQKTAAPPRSASAPPERMSGPPTTSLPARPRKTSITSAHSRRASEREDTIPTVAQIQNLQGDQDDDDDGAQMIVIDESAQQAVLPELQHLAVPPPPPPIPPIPHLATKFQGLANATNPRSASPASASSTGLIDVFIGGNNSGSTDNHRVASPPVGTSISPAPSQVSDTKRKTSGGLVKGFRERLRSESKNRANARSPPNENAGPSPYETVVGGLDRALDERMQNTVGGSTGGQSVYRHPREIKASLVGDYI